MLGLLPVVETQDQLLSQDCGAADLSSLADFVGPESITCQSSQCLVTLALGCDLVQAQSFEDLIRDNPVDQVCSSKCKGAIDTPQCQLPGTQAAYTSFCDCAPGVMEKCGINPMQLNQPWNEVVANGLFCSEECKALMAAGNSCTEFLPSGILDAYGLLCSCGAQLVEGCGEVLGSSDPFSEPCCAAAMGENCIISGTINKAFPDDLVGSIVSLIPGGDIQQLLNATLHNGMLDMIVPGALGHAKGVQESLDAVFSDIAKVVEACKGQSYKPMFSLDLIGLDSNATLVGGKPEASSQSLESAAITLKAFAAVVAGLVVAAGLHFA